MSISMCQELWMVWNFALLTTNSSACDSFTNAKRDTRPLDQRSRMLFLSASQVTRAHFYNGLQAKLTELWGRHIFILLDSEQTCLLLQRQILSLSSQAVHPTNILENIVRNKSCQCFCSQDVQTHQKCTENVSVSSYLLSSLTIQLSWLSCPQNSSS